ncbi:class I SAM-dependent methyltransferase [Streptomyces sp. SM14]|uniref:class I SAM-dependent methyltransferase n=1 Tax=Streptomyces sp. SM14 TaxID=1736045 RepID=UPI000CD58FE6|nr:class I SAM-dependent methyltransferase [Streptomyces sp. SM14]
MAHQTDSTDILLAYVRDVSLRDDEILRGLREETARLPGGASMQVMAEEGQLLALLVRLTGARSVLELGTFTGYSALCMARALPAGGTVVTCDVTDRWPEVGAAFWRRDGLDDRIELRVGDATDTLDELLAERGAGAFDLVFVDADKTNYRTYYEKSLDLTRSGGLLVIDNTLYFGRVADPEFDDADTVAVRELNSALATDERVDISMLPMADGITLVRKR